MNKIKDIFSDFVNLIYPNVCLACGENLLKHENLICMQCLYALPKTNFEKEKNNPVSEMFWGRANIENATALYSFQKKSSANNT